MKKFFLFLPVLFFPFPADAFSDDFLKQMTDLQKRVMLDGKRYASSDAAQCWKKFDDEILSLLSQGRPSEGRLNKETARKELVHVEKKGEEAETIELGDVEAQFYRFRGPSGTFWLAALTNRMGEILSSTVHLYRQGRDGFSRVAAMEEVTGPWDQEKLLSSAIQIQPMPEPETGWTSHFSTYHLSSFKKPLSNRSQIVWEIERNTLKPDLWIPEVDWHTVNGVEVTGRGEAIPVRP